MLSVNVFLIFVVFEHPIILPARYNGKDKLIPRAQNHVVKNGAYDVCSYKIDE